MQNNVELLLVGLVATVMNMLHYCFLIVVFSTVANNEQNGELLNTNAILNLSKGGGW